MAVLELGHLPLAIHGLVGAAGEQSFERRRQTRGHGILCGASLQSGKHRIEAEAGVGADSQLANLGWDISEAEVQHFQDAIPGAGISGAEFCIPEEGGIGFHAEKWVVGLLATIAGIVADGGILLIAEHCNHSAVQIKDQSGSLSGPMYESLQQSVIDAVHLLPENVGCVV